MHAIGSYEILGLIGEGGMGAVYRARDPRFDRLVAIKVLHAQFRRDAGVVDRFRAEAVIQAKLNHPNIVTVLDFVADESTLAMVMEHVEGVPLSQIIEAAGRPLSVDRAVRIMDQVLSAMAFAHARQLVHRDLKPSNILIQTVQNDEFAKVMDFGIAKILGSEKLRTATGAKMGTLAYMSPEHVRSPKNVDARSDVYSLGVVLYEMLAGRVPFDADSEYELMRQIVESPVRPIEHLSPSAAGLVPVVERALAKDPAARFASCTEMREALAAAAQGTPQAASWPQVPGAGPAASRPAVASAPLRRAGAVARSRPAAPPMPVPTNEPERSRRWLGVVAGIAAVVVLAVGGFVVAGAQAEKRRQEVEAARIAAEQDRARAEAERRRLQEEADRLRKQAAEAQRAAETARQAELEREAQERQAAEAARIAAEQEAQRQREAVAAAAAEAARVEAARAAAAADQARIASLAVPRGTPLVLRMRQGISSASAHRGMEVEATLLEELSSEGHTIIPAGARVVGEVQAADSGASGEVPMLVVSFSRIIVAGGGTVGITTDSYRVTGQKRTESDRVANALAGALIGGLFGGKKGAGSGAALGASVDSSQPAQPAVIPANLRVEAQLQSPVRRP